MPIFSFFSFFSGAEGTAATAWGMPEPPKAGAPNSKVWTSAGAAEKETRATFRGGSHAEGVAGAGAVLEHLGVEGAEAVEEKQVVAEGEDAREATAASSCAKAFTSGRAAARHCWAPRSEPGRRCPCTVRRRCTNETATSCGSARRCFRQSAPRAPEAAAKRRDTMASGARRGGDPPTGPFRRKAETLSQNGHG